MALRIRKNSVSPQTPPANPGEETQAPPQDFGEFSNIPSESVDTPQAGAPDSKPGLPLKTSRKKPPIVLLGGLGALLVVAIGAGVANFMMAGNPPEDIPATPPIVRAPQPATGAAPQAAAAAGTHGAPGAQEHNAHPGAANAAKVPRHTPGTAQGAASSPSQTLAGAAAKPIATAAGAGHPKMPPAKPAGPAKVTAPRPASPKSGPAKHSTPAAARPTTVIAPIVTPKPPRAVVHPVIAPVSGGIPGKRDVPGSVRTVSRHLSPNSPLFLQLQQLWTRGRIAKQSNDFAAARSAWQKGLALASADPAAAQSARGFRESLAKLPK
jgi:hypothetical protein